MIDGGEGRPKGWVTEAGPGALLEGVVRAGAGRGKVKGGAFSRESSGMGRSLKDLVTGGESKEILTGAETWAGLEV